MRRHSTPEARLHHIADRLDSLHEDHQTAQHDLLGNVEAAIEEKAEDSGQDDEQNEALEDEHDLKDQLAEIEPETPWKLNLYTAILPAYVLLLQFTPCRFSLATSAHIFFHLLPALYLLLRFPVLLGWMLTEILRRFVIFDDQLSIGAIHLHPWLRKGRLHIEVHVEDLIFGKSGGFQLDFLQVKTFRLQCSLSYEHLYQMVHLVRTWSPVGSTKFLTQDCPTEAQAREAKRAARRELRRKAKLARLSTAGPQTPVRNQSDENGNGVERKSGSFPRRRRSSSGAGVDSVGSASGGNRARFDSTASDASFVPGRSSFSEELGPAEPPELRNGGGDDDDDDEEEEGEDAGASTASETTSLSSSQHRRQAHLKPRLGTIQIENLDIEGAVINFETNADNEFIVNAFVRDLAEAKCRQVLPKQAPFPNTLKVKILQARNLTPHHSSQKNVSPKVEVTCRGETHETHVVFQSRDPTFTCDFDIPLDDPSTVIHVQVLDSSITGSRCIGQWVMTTYWLAVDPTHCQYTPGTLYVSKKNCAIRGWFPLMDFKFQHGDGSRGEIMMEFKWYHNHANDRKNRPRATQPALDQLTENSGETWLRLGDVTRVQTMLETFPYKLEVKRSRLREVHFFLGDLFAGSSGLAESGGRARGIKVKSIELGHRIFSRSRSPGAGVSLNEFLYAFFIKGAVPAVVRSRNIVGAGLREILYSLIMGKRDSLKHRVANLVHGVGSLGEKISHAFDTGNTPRFLIMSLGAKEYHSKTISKEDTDIFRAVRLKGFLLKADRPPGQLLRKMRRIEMTLQGDTLFYWHVLPRKDSYHRQGEGRKMYIQNIVVAEVSGEFEDDMLISLSDGKNRWFQMVEDATEAASLPQLDDWVRVIREQRVVMSHPQLRRDFEALEAKRQAEELSVYTRVY